MKLPFVNGWNVLSLRFPLAGSVKPMTLTFDVPAEWHNEPGDPVLEEHRADGRVAARLFIDRCPPAFVSGLREGLIEGFKEKDNIPYPKLTHEQACEFQARQDTRGGQT